jgi:hypothetical protein
MARSALAACVVGVAVLVGACSGSSRGEAAFCSRLQRDQATLVTGAVDAKSTADTAKNYAALDGLAPEAIRDQWHQLTQLVQSAAGIDASSTQARSALVEQAYAAQPAAQAVTAYAKTACGVDFTAPVTTAPPPPVPTTAAAAPATTATPATTAATAPSSTAVAG